MKTETELKTRAKRLRTAIAAMLGVSVTSAQALELIAKEENYPTWDAATACYRDTTICTQGLSENRDVASLAMLGYEKMFGLYVLGPAGAGKHLQVVNAILNNLKLGKNVFVFDNGKSYRKVAQALGGTEVLLQPSGAYTEQRYGSASLTVFDFADLAEDPWSGRLPLILDDLNAASFIVMDETHYIRRAYPAIHAKFQQWVRQDASFCITGQTEEDIAPFKDVPGPTITMRLARSRLG
ncbi:MAG: glyoxalase superfamily protein [Agitococcus sp.]|nr:glyoxalase superfamily protein [Agitococcus sp.]